MRDVERIISISRSVMGDSFLSPGKKQVDVYKRAVVYKISRELTGFSLESIGEKVGGRDHATVRHGIILFDKEIAKKPHLRLYHDMYRVIRNKAKADIPSYAIEAATTSELLEHVIINQRAHIKKLEDILDKIPNTVKIKYA